MDECIFCRIVAGKAPASVAYEDWEVMAFLDTNPVNPGHLLVVPKRHAVGLQDLEEGLGGRLFQTAQRLAGALRQSGVRCEGVNLFLADGAEAFQEVFHVHLHVIPRFAGDSFRLEADWSVRPPRAELDAVARSIREHLLQAEETR